MDIWIITFGTLLLIAFSWIVSVKHGRYHGIARFFSFESIFVLVMVNGGTWFKNPFSPLQVVSWILLALSLYFAVAGFILLKKIGKPHEGNFENTSVIVKEGLYKFIRHPLYLSLILLGTGAMMKNPAIIQLILGGINLLAIWLTARIEEKEMMDKFGNDYKEYMKDTKMFIPYIL